MSSNAVSGKKRKADALDLVDDESSAPAPAPSSSSASHLPATCLASVLNFMPYADVRRCVLAGKIMAVEAARHVEALNITRASELVVPAARRFGNVSEVNILCLVREVEVDEGRKLHDALSMLTVTQAVPFLASVPNLKRVFLGGWRQDTPTVMVRYPYFYKYCREPDDHQTVFRYLMESLSGGFKSRTLKQDLELKGVFERDDSVDLSQLECTEHLEDVDSPCRCCRSILTFFPLQSIIRLMTNSFILCPSLSEKLKMLLERSGAGEALRSDAGTDMLLKCIDYITLYESFYSTMEPHIPFVHKMKSQGAEFFDSPWYDGEHVVVAYKMGDYGDKRSDLVKLINDSTFLKETLRKIPRSKITMLPPFSIPSKQDGKPIFTQKAFDEFVAMGLNLNARDYILVDAAKEPSLQGMGIGHK